MAGNSNLARILGPRNDVSDLKIRRNFGNIAKWYDDIRNDDHSSTMIPVISRKLGQTRSNAKTLFAKEISNSIPSEFKCECIFLFSYEIHEKISVKNKFKSFENLADLSIFIFVKTSWLTLWLFQYIRKRGFNLSLHFSSVYRIIKLSIPGRFQFQNFFIFIGWKIRRNCIPV